MTPITPMTALIVLGTLGVAIGGLGWARLLAARGWGLVCLAAYAFFVPFGDLVSLPLPGELSSPSTVSGLATMGLLGVGLLAGHRSSNPLSARAWGLAFLGVAVASLLWSRSPALTLDELIVLGVTMSVFFLVASHDARPRDVRRFERAAAAGAAIVGLAALVSAALGTVAVGRSGVPRFDTVGDDPNATAASLILPLAVAVSRAIDEKVSRSERTAMLVGAAIIFGGVALTVSRGGMIASAAVLVLVILHGRNRIRRALLSLVLLGTAGTAALLTMPLASGRLTTTASTGRLDIWRLGLHACTRECDIGAGFGTFPFIYREEFLTNPSASGFRDEAFKAHNIFVQMIVETGVAGLIFFVATLATVTLAAWRLPATHRAAPFAAMTGLLITNSLITNSTFKYFWLAPAYVALTTTSLHLASAPARPPANRSDGGERTPFASPVPTAPRLKVSVL